MCVSHVGEGGRDRERESGHCGIEGVREDEMTDPIELPEH